MSKSEALALWRFARMASMSKNEKISALAEQADKLAIELAEDAGSSYEELSQFIDIDDSNLSGMWNNADAKLDQLLKVSGLIEELEAKLSTLRIEKGSLSQDI